MALLLALYILLIISLTALAIYEHHTSTTLSLPLSPTLTTLTLLLPLLSLLSTSTTFLSPSHPHPRKTPLLLPLFSNLLQILLTIILATLFGSTLTSPFTPCALQTTWRTHWTTHSPTPIRTIQDSLSCCGFKSTKDMAWPFPSSGNNGDVTACEKQFNRHTPCAGLWEEALKRTAGVELGVVVITGLVQVLSLVLFNKGRKRQRRGGKGEWWGRVVEILFAGGAGGDDMGGDTQRRPLLTGGRGDAGGGYIDANREVEDGDEDDVEEHWDEGRSGRPEGNGYGGTARSAQTHTQPNGEDDRGPRVEVSHHDPWAGAERV
ncbi:hypothetical protein QBC41DRAFT_14726 [Cercophora samala]|uniref:Tetraspanin n=1 Tax=Cercophora samala TaxID=330535 RepID=A0AA39Z7U0_9PEZI|nr:hypothetical protein QBC41DRAFT_14726 [Cercophora samala]